MIEEIVKRLLDSLGRFDFWIAIVALMLSIVVWCFVGSKNKTEKKKLKRQLTMTATVIAVAGGVIWIRHLIPPRPFPQNVAGILILRIAGDDSVGSFQSRLVSSLNAELASIAARQRIEVWADDESVDEKRGLDESHKAARGVGEKRNALLLIWGNKVDDIRFFPRITIVRQSNKLQLIGERTLSVQDIHDVALPTETVTKPVYLAYFVSGYSLFERQDYRIALEYFEAAQSLKQATDKEAADLQYCLGTCHSTLVRGGLVEAFGRGFTTVGKGEAIQAHVKAAIDNLALAASYYAQTTNLKYFAAAQVNLGAVYADRGDLKEAMAANSVVLERCTEKDCPYEWAVAQLNLGVAYFRLGTGDREENLKRAMAACQAALRVFNEKDFPGEWALTQNNLGAAYLYLNSHDRVANIKLAIAAFHAALRVRTEKDWPVAWAETQENLGLAYVELPAGDRAQNLKEAKDCFLNALKIFDPQKYPEHHLVTTRNLEGVQNSLRALGQN